MSNHFIYTFDLVCLGFKQLSCGFALQDIVSYISQSLQEKKLLYFGMENLDFNFVDPVSIGPVVSYSVCTTYISHKTHNL